MNKKMTMTLAALTLSWSASAQTPGPETLLPENTLAAIVAPSLTQLAQDGANDPLLRMLGDPAMRPFMDRLKSGITAALLPDINRELGFEIESLRSLCQGQLALAVTSGRAFQTPGAPPGFLVLLDAQDQGPLLKSILDTIIAGITEDATNVDRREIGATTFTSVSSDEDDFTLSIGIAGSVLVIGSETADLEGVMARLEGSATGALERNRRFRSDYGSQLKEASVYGWLNVAPLTEFAMEMIPEAPEGSDAMAPDPKDVIQKLGLLAIQSLTFASRADADASEVTFAINAPESERTGLLALMDGANDLSTTPPAFVPADIAGFSRTRVDLKDVVTRVENLIKEIVPPVGGMLQFMMAGVGKDQDPQFDLRRDFINQLGDDVITLVKAFDDATLEAVTSQQQLFLLGSPQPEKLQYALGILSSMVPADVFKKSERDYKGSAILSFEAQLPEEVQTPGFNGLHFATKEGYLAISTLSSTLESFLTAERVDRPLSRDPAFRAAAEANGGTDTGMLTYENMRLTTAPLFDVLRTDESIRSIVDEALQNLIDDDAPVDAEEAGEWIDLSLLPETAAIAQYFPIATGTGRRTADGFEFTIYSPVPRELK